MFVCFAGLFVVMVRDLPCLGEGSGEVESRAEDSRSVGMPDIGCLRAVVYGANC